MYMSLWMDDVSIGELPPIMLLFFTDCTMAAPLSPTRRSVAEKIADNIV